MRQKPLMVAFVVILAFLVCINLTDGLRLAMGDGIKALSRDSRRLLMYVCWLVPLVAVTGWLARWQGREALVLLGLHVHPGRGLLLAFMLTMPMLAGYAAFLPVNRQFGWHDLMFGAVLAAFMEELLFRGFLFGLLFNVSGWGFVPAALANGVLFASGHLYQAGDVMGAVQVLLVTFLGAAWFAWLYVEWDSLWVPIGMHLFMNLWWMVFSAGETAVGGTVANICRIAVIVLSVVVTIRYRKRHGGFRVNRKTWLIRRAD